MAHPHRAFVERSEAACAIDGKGQPEAAFRHVNPDGTLGGWVAASASVARESWIHPQAIILTGAVIRAGVDILEPAIIDSDTAAAL
jgi:UDP-3-O-[3-hydroxymyristoyl] glucosamine N-acyltransferase